MSKKTDIATRHLGVISQRCLYHWRRLPPSVQAGYDPEDMIGDVVLKVVKVSARYSAKRAKEVTWVWWVADNECKAIVSKYACKKRGQNLIVPMPENEYCNPAVGKEDQRRKASIMSSPERERHLVESRNAVERTIQFAPDAARDLLSRLLTGRVRGRVDPETVESLRQAARSQRATLGDFELAYRCLVA